VRGYFPAKKFIASRFVLFSSRASVGGGPYVIEDSYAFSSRETDRGLQRRYSVS
jgi:2'-5' RNA ligase